LRCINRFYVVVTKPFPKEVTDVSNPLCDAGLSCSESSDLGAMVEVLADVWRVVNYYCGQAVGKLRAESMMSIAASLFPQ
jgi:hypothetical protein